MQIIPLQAVPSQRLQVVLDGQNCTLALRTRGRFLYADLAVGGAAVFCGAICRHGAEISQSESLRFSGTLHFYDTLGGRRDPEYSGLGERWQLLFIPAGEDIPAALQN